MQRLFVSWLPMFYLTYKTRQMTQRELQMDTLSYNSLLTRNDTKLMKNENITLYVFYIDYTTM